MTQGELQEILEKHAAWIAGNQNGKRADLRIADLSGADLSGADLRRADLSGADLSGADLSGANLRWANLRRADLRGADLSGADLRRADLRWVDLRWVDLRGATVAEDITIDRPPIQILGGQHDALLWPNVIKIGCHTHPVETWRNATDEQITEWGGDPDEWDRWKPALMAIVENMK